MVEAWAIVDASRAPEDDELADALDTLKNPKVTTLDEISTCAAGTLGMWLHDRKNARQIPHRMEAVGYVAVRIRARCRWKSVQRRVIR